MVVEAVCCLKRTALYGEEPLFRDGILRNQFGPYVTLVVLVKALVS